MSLSELTGYAVIAAAGIAYWLYHNWAKVRGVAAVANDGVVPVTPPASDANWRQEWIATLLTLADEMEGRDDEHGCVPLVRELVWRMMGGAPNDLPAQKAAKK